MYDKDSLDHQLNLEVLHDMEECVPMTLKERSSLRKWVHTGHDPESNPWDYMDTDSMPLNYLQAYRLKFGYSSGPWDYWKGPDTQTYWNDELECFIGKDEL